MKIMISSDVNGDFETLGKDYKFCNPDLVCIVGNVGIGEETVWDFLTKKNTFGIDSMIYYVTGHNEDFGTLKKLELPDSTYAQNHFVNASEFPYSPTKHHHLAGDKELVSITGVSGTYSPKYYKEDHAPLKHMTRKQLFSVSKNVDVCLLHNVPGKLGSAGKLDFDLELFSFLQEKSPKYVFVGGYKFEKPVIFTYLGSNVVFLPGIESGYAILDTSDWSCKYNNKLVD